MPANPWELRADVRPLDAAALRWEEVGALMARRGDELVDVARRATEGWDAAAAESYDQHRRQVLTNLDRFTTLTSQVASSLRAVSAIVTAAQKELDQAWTKVAMIPHDVIGDSGYLVWRPSEDDDRGKVDRGQLEAEEIRGRLALGLDQESTRLRAARAELVLVRTELMGLAGSAFPRGLAPGEEEAGVGAVLPPSTSLPGAAQGGVGALPPIAPISVSMPDLDGISATGLTPFAAAAAAAAASLAGRRRSPRPAPTGTPPVGGMAAGGMAGRAGTMARSTSGGAAGGRAGARRLSTPKLEGRVDDEAARAARARGASDPTRESADEAEKAAKRAALEEKRAERAARRAEREAEKRQRDRLPEPDLVDDDDAPDAGHEAGAGGVRG